MKPSFISRLFTAFAVILAMNAFPTQAEPRDQALRSFPATAYISDELEIPLRAGASERYKVIGIARCGTPVTVLKVDTAKGYTQVRTATGVKGWLPNAQLTQTPSSQEQLVHIRQELEQLQARHTDLQQHMDTVVNKPDAEAMSYPQLYEEALRLRQQMAEYRKVAADTVAIDERNKALQERTVALERELRIIQQENQTVRNDNENIRFLMGAVILAACLAVVVIVPRLREQKREQWNRL